MRKWIGISEIIVIIGIVSLFIGFYLFKPWLAYSITGLIIIILGILTARL